MGMKFELEDSGFKGFIPDGTILAAKCVGIKKKEKPWKDKETGEPIFKMEFKFEIIDDESQWLGQELWGETGTRYNNHPYCKLFTWSQALLGFPLLPEYELDTDDILDKECRVLVRNKTYEQAGVEKERNEVADVLPARENMANFTDELAGVGATAGGADEYEEEPF